MAHFQDDEDAEEVDGQYRLVSQPRESEKPPESTRPVRVMQARYSRTRNARTHARGRSPAAEKPRARETSLLSITPTLSIRTE
jgi:hypothetical protein